MAAALIAGLGLLAACSSDNRPFPTPTTVMANVEESVLVSQGWTTCYTDTYADSGTTLSSIIAGCGGTSILLACRPVGNSAFSLAAQAPANIVLTDTGQDTTTTTDSGGAVWYYNEDYSWGFAPAGETVFKDSCDFDQGSQTSPDSRLCWHTNTGSIDSGYRCGDNDLNGDSGWQRVVMTR